MAWIVPHGKYDVIFVREYRLLFVESLLKHWLNAYSVNDSNPLEVRQLIVKFLADFRPNTVEGDQEAVHRVFEQVAQGVDISVEIPEIETFDQLVLMYCKRMAWMQSLQLSSFLETLRQHVNQAGQQAIIHEPGRRLSPELKSWLSYRINIKGVMFSMYKHVLRALPHNGQYYVAWQIIQDMERQGYDITPVLYSELFPIFALPYKNEINLDQKDSNKNILALRNIVMKFVKMTLTSPEMFDKYENSLPSWIRQLVDVYCSIGSS